MGFFQAGVNDEIAGRFDPVNQGFQANTGAFGEQAAGNTDRATAAYTNQGNLYNKIGGMLFSGQFDTPGTAGVSRAKERSWWEKMQGTTPDAGSLQDPEGNDVRSYASMATGGYLNPAQQLEYEQNIRERPASQARSATSSILDQMRRGGASGWGGGGEASALAAQKNLLSSLRSGNMEANQNIADQLIEGQKYGREGMERAQGQIQGLQDIRGTAGHKAGMGEYLAYLNADPTGSALDWSKMANANLGGSTSALSGWGGNVSNQMGASREQSGLGQTVGAIGTIGSAVGSIM